MFGTVTLLTQAGHTAKKIVIFHQWNSPSVSQIEIEKSVNTSNSAAVVKFWQSPVTPNGSFSSMDGYAVMECKEIMVSPFNTA